MTLHARLYPGTSRIYNLSPPPSVATLIRSDFEHCYSCYRFYDRTCPMVLYSVIFRLTVAQEVLALLNAAFSERDEAKLRLEIANMKLDSFKRQEEKEADARDVLLIAGKGHEAYQEYAGVKRPFDDMQVARATLEARPC